MLYFFPVWDRCRSLTDLRGLLMCFFSHRAFPPFFPFLLLSTTRSIPLSLSCTDARSSTERFFFFVFPMRVPTLVCSSLFSRHVPLLSLNHTPAPFFTLNRLVRSPLRTSFGPFAFCPRSPCELIFSYFAHEDFVFFGPLQAICTVFLFFRVCLLFGFLVFFPSFLVLVW